MKTLSVFGVLLVGVIFCDAASTSTQLTPAEISSASVVSTSSGMPPASTINGSSTSVMPPASTINASSLMPSASTINASSLMPPASTINGSSPAASSVTPFTVSLVTITTSPGPTPKPDTGSSFDGASFGGGFVLGLGVAIILFIIFVLYRARKTKGYNTM